MPAYPVPKVQQLASEGRWVVTIRVRRWLENHGYPVSDIVHGVMEELDASFFRKTDELRNIPGTMADIYVVPFDGEEWYLKLFIGSDGGIEIVNIWSLRIEGFNS